MPPPGSNDTGTALGQDGSDWSRDLATLTSDLGGYDTCGWCGSSPFFCVPSLKFVGLAVRKIWCTMCVSINGPDLLTLKLVCESHQRWGTFLPNLGTLALCVFEFFAIYATDRWTDGRTGGQKQRLPPPSLCAWHNNKRIKTKICLIIIINIFVKRHRQSYRGAIASMKRYSRLTWRTAWA